MPFRDVIKPCYLVLVLGFVQTIHNLCVLNNESRDHAEDGKLFIRQQTNLAIIDRNFFRWLVI